MKKKISIVCPIYNEEENIKVFFEQIDIVLKKIQYDSEIIFINDGSDDDSLNILILLSERYGNIKIINLSRNFGKEQALTAGLDNCSGDAIIPIDVDLQDPPELILEFIKYWETGEDVVLAKRVDRSEDSFLKLYSASLFYKFHNNISDVKIPDNVGDYRLISRKVLNAINQLPENQRFMKGIFSWVGFKAKTIEYKRASRKFGTTKFNGWKLWNFALEGITSFSTFPLRIWTYVGLTFSVLSFFYASFIVFNTLIYGVQAPGYASILVIVLFMGSLQLIGIGVLGEYIGRIYIESKKRPAYIIDTIYEVKRE